MVPRILKERVENTPQAKATAKLVKALLKKSLSRYSSYFGTQFVKVSSSSTKRYDTIEYAFLLQTERKYGDYISVRVQIRPDGSVVEVVPEVRDASAAAVEVGKKVDLRVLNYKGAVDYQYLQLPSLVFPDSKDRYAGYDL